MAIYRLSMSVVSRSQGRSSVAAAAYRAGERIRDERTGRTHDYRNKQNIAGTEILAPKYAPSWTKDRAQLWNRVEASEKRCDSQVARECLIALPRELDHAQCQHLTRQFASESFVSRGMVADIAWHDTSGQNPHAHILLTTRQLGPNGFGKKNRGWNKRSFIGWWRQSWELFANQALEKSKHPQRIDHRSLEAQGINRIPQIKMGKAATALERKGIRTQKGDELREILARNQQIENLEFEIKNLESIKAELEQVMEQTPNTQDLKPDKIELLASDLSPVPEILIEAETKIEAETEADTGAEAEIQAEEEQEEDFEMEL